MESSKGVTEEKQAHDSHLVLWSLYSLSLSLSSLGGLNGLDQSFLGCNMICVAHSDPIKALASRLIFPWCTDTGALSFH
jgi:hypothetical protein